MFTTVFKKIQIFIMLCSVFALAACSSTPDSDVPTGTDIYIDSIEVFIMESFPVQASVLVQGNLADGCVSIADMSVVREDNTFAVTIETQRDGEMCTEALVPFEENIPLDVLGLQAGTYTVAVNDATTSFTLDMDNVLQEDSTESETGDRVTLERTACFGTCPIYTVTIYTDGRVVYDGRDFVDVSGAQESQIDPADVSALVTYMQDNGYFELEDAYNEVLITDMPSAITSLTVDGQTKRIDHYFGDESAPFVLQQIENRIDQLANTEQWTGAEVQTTGGLFGQVIVRGLETAAELPAGTVITVRLEDVSLMDAPSVVIAERVYTDITQLPMFYDLVFDLNAIDPALTYAVSAAIVDAEGNALYWNDTMHPVLTYGAGSTVDIEMVPAQ